MIKNKYYSQILFILIVIISVQTSIANITSYDIDSFDSLKLNKYIDSVTTYISVKPDNAKPFIDSLLVYSTDYQNDYGLFKSYNFLGIYYWMYRDYDSAIYNYRRAMGYSDMTSDARNKALVMSNMGLLYSNLFITDSAIKYFNKTIEYSKKYDVKDILIKASFDLGGLYLNQANYVEAIKYLKLVEDSLKTNPNPRLNILIHNSIGSLYYHVEDFDNSIKYFNEALKLDEDYDGFNIIPNIYINIAQDYLELKESYDTARMYFTKAIEYANDYNKQFVELNTDIGYGNTYMEEHIYDSANVYYLKALNNPNLESSPSHLAAVLINLGKNYLEMKDYEKANSFLLKGIAMADSAGILHYQQIGLKALVNLKNETSRFQEGLKYYNKLQIIEDSVDRENTKHRMERINFEKYLADKEFNIQLLEKENNMKTRLLKNRNVLLWISLLTLLIIIVYLVNVYLNRKKIKHLAGELAAKNEDLGNVNEELRSLNEELTVQQEKLVEANQAKDKFFTIIAHDLKSPFNSLLGFLNLLKSDWDTLDDNEKKTIVTSLHSNSIKTFELLEGLLDWGKTQRGLIKASKLKFNVKSELDEIVRVNKSQLENKELILENNVENTLEIYNDQKLFRHIIMNILNNAIKFTPRGGSITIYSENKNGKDQICIKDTGIGFPNDVKSKVFTFDFDYNRSGTESEKSTGMGLILISEYARIMGASLSLESKENEGSTFKLSL